MKRRQYIPSKPVTVAVEKFSHDGRGIARIDGKTTFIQGALPNETVSFKYTRLKKDYDEGRVLSIIEPSSERIDPHCPHYTRCGGCSFQHLEQALQIKTKEALLLDLMQRVGKVEPETMLPALSGEPWHYRNKARLSVRYIEKKAASLVGFRERNNPNYITDIHSCSILNKNVSDQLLTIRQLLDSLESSRAIAQVEVAAGDKDVALIFRNLVPLGSLDEEKMKAFAVATGFRVFLQPAGPDSVYLLYPEDNNPYLTYELPEAKVVFQFHPTDFTQINPSLNRLMVQQALGLLALNKKDIVLDLFCGLGNFSLPIAQQCARVVGVEGSEAMVARAEMNAKHNQITNVSFFAANLEEPGALTPCHHEAFTKILIDPPRSGAQEIMNQMHKMNPSHIVYVSCNPATLARDAAILVNQKGFRLKALGVMDMFPHTAHVESIALFEKR